MSPPGELEMAIVSYDADVDAWELVVDAPALAAALLHAEGPITSATDMGHRSQRIGEKARCTFAGVATNRATYRCVLVARSAH